MIYISRTAPTILTDAKFLNYGGSLGSTTAAQRCVAYTEAELMVERYLNTYLSPTTVTGTYPWPQFDSRLALGVNYVSSVSSVVPLHELTCEQPLQTGTGYARLLWPNTGLIDLRLEITPNCGCWSGRGRLYQVQVVYTAGLGPEFATDPLLLSALKSLASWWLTFNLDPGGFAGGEGDPGIISWSSLDYQETRQKMQDTVFGSTPLANSLARILKHLKQKPALKL